MTHAVEYDTRDRVKTLGAGSALAPGAMSLGYGYDRSSLVTTITDPRAGHTQAFGYDALGRLTSAQGAYGALTWSYAANGDRLTEGRSVPGGSLVYSYHATTKRLESITGLASASFTYGADGRILTQVQSSGTTTYGYTPTSLPTSVSAPGVSVSSAADADEWRIRRQTTTSAGTSTTYSLRSLDAQVLSQYRVEACAGAPLEWTSDLIYAGGRLIGSFDADPSAPVVQFMWAGSSPLEQTGSVGIAVTLTTATGAPLACPVTVTWDTPAGGTATPGVDYVPQPGGTLTFPTGFTSGNYLGIGTTIPNDSLDEPVETFAARLTGATGAVLGPTTIHTLSIQDDDAPPVLHLTNTSVSEGTGQASVTVSLSGASGHTVTATVATSPGSAVATHDFTPTTVSVTLLPGTVSQTVPIPLTNDGYAEPVESFTVTLSAPTNATLGTSTGAVSIADDDGPHVTIDPTYPGDYFALAHATASDQTYLQIYNPHTVAVTARITYVNHLGQGVRREIGVGPKARVGLHVNADAFIQTNVLTSAVVQSLDTTRPLVAELANYWGTNWAGGEATEGTVPSHTWYFAEGATGLSVGFQEYYSVFNPGTDPVNVVMQFFGASGQIHSKIVEVPAGPGVSQFHVNSELPSSEHSVALYAVARDGGQARDVVVERLLRWSAAGGGGGHRGVGARTASSVWEFAEGGSGAFSTFVAIFNPAWDAASMRVHYRHENGSIYSTDVTVPARGRVVVATPSWVPTGGFGLQVQSLSGHWVSAERSIYEASGWTFGHSSPGAPSGGTYWRFAEGSAVSFFDTYFLVTNTTHDPATITFTYRNAGGTVLGTQQIGVLPGLRGGVWANAAAAGQDFTTEVSSTAPVLVERAMYWPTSSGASALSASTTVGGEEALAARPPDPALLRPFTVTEGTMGPTVVVTTDPEAASPLVGLPRSAAKTSGASTTQSVSGLPWYGSHLAVGKKP